MDLNREKKDSMKDLFEIDLPDEFCYNKKIDINSQWQIDYIMESEDFFQYNFKGIYEHVIVPKLFGSKSEITKTEFLS